MSEILSRNEDSPALNRWPSSKLCMNCEHGEYVSGGFGLSVHDDPVTTYLCKEQIQLEPYDSFCELFYSHHPFSDLDYRQKGEDNEQ